MNQHPGIIGRKIGCTQVFQPNGDLVACTVIETSSCVVVGHRTQERDGYSALILGFGKKKSSRINKPMAGQFKKSGVEVPQHIKEFRLAPDNVAKHPVGKALNLSEIFEEGQFVDVQGQTRGRGFTGVMRRWNFAGSVNSHGTHEYFRHGGSIGTNMTPGRTLPNLKMPGQYGNETLSMLNQKIVKIDAEKGLLLLHGGVPGPSDSIVYVRGSIKKNGGKPAQK